MDFRVLGPLEVYDGGAGVIPVRAAKERALLLILLLHKNEVVPTERLIDQLWGERPPASAANVLQTYVSHLRRLLTPVAGRADRDLILTRRPGYVLRVEQGQLDLDRHEALVAEARSSDDPARALTKLQEALSLWRGPPLQEFAFEEFAQTTIARLEELRVATIEERVELELQLGLHGDLVGELETLVAVHPLRERLRGQLMLALYRSGRQAEALQAYQDARRLLVEELGIEPGGSLRKLEQEILRQDAALEPHAPATPEVSPPVRPPMHAPAAEVRKTVTVLFSDLVESTSLGHRFDPEALRHLMSRYFQEMRVVVERHGGTVEKFVGDAIMAVFGVPRLHEDDALRGVRAAAEMQEALAALNEELERVWGVRLAARIGVNTGDVFASDPSEGHLFVTGEAVNVAKRLEEVAATNEILIGEPTYRLVRDAVTAEPAEERTSRRGEVVRAIPLVALLTPSPGRASRFDSPLVDRERQLGALLGVFADVMIDRTGHLFTVLGSAGVGKSRLTQEFVARLGEEVTVLRGRCLPYGESITYWPIAEIVREAAGTNGEATPEDSVSAIAAQLAGEAKAGVIAERVGAALGLGQSGAGASEETFWAFRKFFEALARQESLVVVLDDLQWAETTFLDLVEHVVTCSRDAPILFLCIARPELLDTRPSWGGGMENATSILLKPLSDDECRQLIAYLATEARLPEPVEARIAAAAEGNPLFAEELLAMLIDEGSLTREGGDWIASDALSQLRAPPSIQALLATRVERLPDEERALVERAAVEGVVFHRSALTDLSPDLHDDVLDRALLGLVRKEVIRRDRATFAGDDAFRFRHVLIRDAAYDSLPKRTRADLHERFAAWLERIAGERLREFEEIVGYHLEQAYRCRLELGSIDAHAASLAARAAKRLDSAGRRALARGDLPAAIGLFERALSLFADDATRLALLPEFGAALIEAGRFDQAEHVLEEARRLAAAADDECADSHALVQQQFLELLRVAEDGTAEAARAVQQVVPVFERCDDDQGLCRARQLEAWLHWNDARAAEAAKAWEQAAAHAGRAGNDHARAEILTWIASSLWFGPTPAGEGIGRCEEIRAEVSGNLESEALTLRHLAGLHAMEGRFELARELLAESNAVFEDLGPTLNAATSHNEAVVELLAGDPVAAERSLRWGYRALEQMGEKAFLSTTAAFLARALVAQGRDEEAERLTELSAQLAANGDVLTQMLWRGVQSGIFLRSGRLAEAESLAREAASLAEKTDFTNHRGDALIDLAQVLHHTGCITEAGKTVYRAVRLYEQKGNVIAATRIPSELAVLVQV